MELDPWPPAANCSKIVGMSQTLADIAGAANRAQAGTAGRLVSLDAFRGAVMAFMILVNTPGDGRHVYWPLEHAEWHRWTPTDVVFPSFLWIVGLAMTLSLGRKLARGAARADLFRTAARRAAILFVLGVLIYVYPAFDLHTERIMGVLQRIAICYLAAAAIFLGTKLRGQIVWIVSLMAVYWLLMAFVPVPGYGAGRLDVEGNFAHYIDRIVLGSHNYIWTKTWDPEGIVSTLPAIATCLLGVIAGHMVASQRSLGNAACACSAWAPSCWRPDSSAISGCLSTRSCGPIRSRCSWPAWTSSCSPASSGWWMAWAGGEW